MSDFSVLPSYFIVSGYNFNLLHNLTIKSLMFENHCSRGVKRQNQNISLLYLKYLPRGSTQNNNGSLHSLAQIKNRYKTVRALPGCAAPLYVSLLAKQQSLR